MSAIPEKAIDECQRRLEDFSHHATGSAREVAIEFIEKDVRFIESLGGEVRWKSPPKTNNKIKRKALKPTPVKRKCYGRYNDCDRFCQNTCSKRHSCKKKSDNNGNNKVQ